MPTTAPVRSVRAALRQEFRRAIRNVRHRLSAAVSRRRRLRHHRRCRALAVVTGSGNHNRTSGSGSAETAARMCRVDVPVLRLHFRGRTATRGRPPAVLRLRAARPQPTIPVGRHRPRPPAILRTVRDSAAGSGMEPHGCWTNPRAPASAPARLSLRLRVPSVVRCS